MKIFFYPALFLLGFITTVTAQTNNNYPQWQHPILKELRAGSKTLTPFYNKDSTAFVTVAIIDKKQKSIYWFDCYGYYFDAVPIPENNIQAITKKNITAFKYYDLITTDYIKLIIKARNNFQENGNAAKFTPYEKQVLQIDDSIKFPSTLKKLIELDKQKLSVERQIREFHSINPTKIKEDTVFSKTLAIQYGSMVTSYNGQDTLTTYYNRIAFEPVYKAILNHNNATITYYNRGEQLIDVLKINKSKTSILLNEKTDVFLIYRGWLELQRYGILDQIKNLKKSQQEYIKSHKKEDEFLFANNSFQTVLSYTNQLLKITNYNIDYLTTVDRGFVSQCLKKQYQQTSNSLSASEAQLSTFTRGNKFYELTDARGNVMAVITDKKIQHSSNNTTVDYYEPDIVSATDYAPFGMTMPGRNYQSDKYRYGYNGKENDNEVKGQGNQQDYGMRIYDPRLGRFLSVDPLIDKYPELSSYQYTNNSPIANIDLDGQEDYYYMLSFDAKTGKSQLNFNEKRDVGLWGIGNIFASDCLLEYPISIGGKEYTAEYYLATGNTQPSQAALNTYNGKTKDEIAKILANTPTKWGAFADNLKKDADDTEQRISEGFVIGAAIQRNNLIKQQTAANNKISPSGQKNSTTNSGNQNTGGNNNQTSPQKAGALTNTGSAGDNATTVTSSAEMKPYGGPGGGHHVPAKSGFTNAAGYDLNKALAIPNAELNRLGVNHATVTGAQMKGYKALAASGQAITWESMSTIEVNALKAGGMSAEMANSTVTKAVEALKNAGVKQPTRIPWGGN